MECTRHLHNKFTSEFLPQPQATIENRTHIKAKLKIRAAWLPQAKMKCALWITEQKNQIFLQLEKSKDGN